MPNRFIFSLRFSTKVFIKLAILAVAMIFFMTLFRLNLYFLSVFHATPNVDIIEVFHSFVAGLRFDILVLGFLFIPLYFILIIQAFLQKWPRKMYVFYKVYFSCAWFLICLTSLLDFFHFTQFGRRMRYDDYMAWTPETLLEQAQRLQPNQVWIFCIITVLLFVLGFTLTKALRFGDWKDEYSPHGGSKFETFLRIFVPLFVVALAARGTVEPHHLALEHSEVSSNKSINEMALNAVWCFDK